MKILIRKFHPADTSALLSLYYETIQNINIHDYSQEQIDAWISSKTENLTYWQDRFLGSNTVVAEIDDKIVGFGNLRNGECIDMLYVDKDFQRKGVGTDLLENLEEKLKKDDIKKVVVESSITARPFFERAGYTLVRENRKSVNGVDLVNFIMEKELNGSHGTSDKRNGRRKNLSWRDLLTNKAFDLFIVIAGVTIAFQLNGLKESNDQKSLERFYLQSMVNDLDLDILEYEDNLSELNSDRRLVNSCLARIERNEDVRDSLAYVVLNILYTKTFEGHRNTYSTILNSNGLSLLKNPEIRNLMLEHYRLYAAIERFEVMNSELISRINDYFSQHIDYGHADEVKDPALGANIQTKNLLTISAVQLQSGIWRYEESLEKARLLRKIINSYLVKRN